MPHFSIDKSSGMGSITIGVTPAGINESQNPIQEYLKIRVGNTTTTIPLTHKAGEVTYKYIFNVSPTGNVQIGSEGGSIPYTVESIRESYIGGVLINTESNWGYQVECDSGITNNGSTLSVGANPNSWEVTKNVKITQNDSGKTVVINITQLASSVQSDYQFFVSPTSLGYEPIGGSKSFSITSNKVTTINGNQETTPINYSTQTSDSWIHVSGTTISVDSANAEIQRSGSVVFTQSESNKQATITITQQGNKVETSYTFTLDPTAKTIPSGGGNFFVTIISTKTVTTNNVPETTQVSYEAKASESWIKVSGDSITVNQNSGDKNRVGTVTFTQAETGDSLVLTISQNGVTVSTSYKFSLNKSSMRFSSAGGTDNYTVASTKTVTIDGTPSTTNIGYTSSASDSWITVSNGTIRVSVNNSEKSRTGSVLFTQNESGNQATLIISQDGQTVSTDYQFSVNPDNVTHKAQGGITSFSVISNKIVTTDGVPVTTQLGYTMGTVPSWITKNSNSKITIAENPNESPRSTTITFTQNESGKQVTATINQAGRVALTNGFAWTNSSNSQWLVTKAIVQKTNPTTAPSFSYTVYSVKDGVPYKPSPKILNLINRDAYNGVIFEVSSIEDIGNGRWEITVTYSGDINKILDPDSGALVSRLQLLEVYQEDSHWEDIKGNNSSNPYGYQSCGKGNHKRLAMVITFNYGAIFFTTKQNTGSDKYCFNVPYTGNYNGSFACEIGSGTGGFYKTVSGYEYIMYTYFYSVESALQNFEWYRDSGAAGTRAEISNQGSYTDPDNNMETKYVSVPQLNNTTFTYPNIGAATLTRLTQDTIVATYL